MKRSVFSFLIVFLLIQLSACASHSNAIHVLTDHSYRQISIGMPVEEVLATLPNVDADIISDAESGCFYLQPNENAEGVYIMVMDETVARFDIVEKSNVVTERGVGIGFSKLDILNAYPNVTVKPHEYLGEAGEYLFVKLPSGNGLVFETEFDIVSQYRMGRFPAAGYVEGCL